MILFRLAFRNIFRHRTRSLITLCGIAFGSVAIIFIGGFFQDSLDKMRDGYIKGHTGHFQLYKQGFFAKGAAKPFDFLIEQPQEIAAQIAKIPGVRHVAQRILFAGLLGTGETSTSCFVQGVQPEYEVTINQQQFVGNDSSDTFIKMAVKAQLRAGLVISKGQGLSKEQEYGIVLGQGLAASIAAHVGDNLTLMTNTVGGSINAIDVKVQGIFYTASKDFDDRAIRILLPTAQKLLNTDAVQALVVLLEDAADEETFEKQLQELLNNHSWELEIKSWKALNDFYVKTEILFWNYYSVVILVVCVIVILSIFNTMNMSVLERTTEIGTVMALGMKPQVVVRLFLYEGLILGILGGVLGLVLGAAVIAISHTVGIPMPAPPGASFGWLATPVIVPSEMLRAFVLSVAISSLSGLYPAYKASRMEIAQALRHVL